MIRFLADENFSGRIVRGLRSKMPDVPLVRVQDTELYSADDPAILEWAAREGYILLTHDKETMIGYAYQRVAKNLPMMGVLVVRDKPPIAQVIDNLLLVLGASEAHEWENVVEYLPL